MADTVIAPAPINLDNGDSAAPGPFEGPEKLLEVWFAPGPSSLRQMSAPSGSKQRAQRPERQPYKGLRTVPREVWEEMLDIVKCKVLSVVEGEEIDAYLLR